MKVCTCFLLFGIFAYTNSISRIRSKEDHSVFNLSQESAKEYSNEEYSGDTNNLDNVHNFITKSTNVQDKNKDMILVFRAPRVETLTDFIQEAVKILNTYEDTAFEDFFHVLDNEIRKYHYRGCKFSELTQNSDTRRLLAGSLKLIRGKPVSFTKASINEVADMMRYKTYDKNVKELLDYISSLYANTELNFHSVLNELKYYRNTKSVRTHNNLVQFIRGGVRAVLFNPYTELNTNTRRELRERIDFFWKHFKNHPASSAEMNDIPNTDTVIESVIDSFEVSENIMNEGKNPERYSKNDPQLKLKHKRERFVSLDAYDEQLHRDETEKDESSNESGKQITNYNTDVISSGQSFDSSSNSIKNSQEQHEEYNTQRYMTLYTEEISYKAKTTKKAEIIPVSANVMISRPKVKKQPMSISTPRERYVLSNRTEKIEILRANHDTDDTKLDISNSSHDTEGGLTLEPRARENYDKTEKIEILRAHHDTDDTKLDISNSSHDTEGGLTLELRARENYDKTEKIEILRAHHNTDGTKLDISNSSHDTESGLTLKLRARENYDKQQKQGKADELRSKIKQKNVEIIRQYDAVIDVQLANTGLLKSLSMLEPAELDTK